ncbi:MAG: hypothetical protein LBP76_10220, partial [Treponema sp.]|nr:hypothetical protein [Treponema sp.]
DIAKKRDYFALMIFHDNAQIINGNKILESPDRVLHYYDIKKIEQYQGLGYEEMAARIAVILNNPQLRMNADLVVDGTGVGEAAVELMRKRGLYPIPVIFGGGDAPREHYAGMGEVFGGGGGPLSGAKILKDISVPKKDLVAAGNILLQQGRVRAAPGRWNEDFKRQLSKFKGKVNESAKHTKYEAETERDHDDLVVCFLMGAWWILNRRERGANPERASPGKETAGWEPDDYM